jgi:diketogulonate reductase-like aldo/keto reductase
VPLGDTLGAMNDLRARGLTRHIGVSNFTTALLAEAIRLSEAPLVADQVEYHPYLDQSKVHAACRAAGMAMVSYCPLHRGGELLSEKPVLDAARAHGRTPGQIVLRWHVQQEGVVAIPRTTRKERLKENLDVFGFSLTGAEMAAISGLARDGSRLCDFKFSPKWD